VAVGGYALRVGSQPALIADYGRRPEGPLRYFRALCPSM